MSEPRPPDPLCVPSPPTDVSPSVWTRDLAVDLLLMIPDNELQLVKLCSFHPGCMEERDGLREKVVGCRAGRELVSGSGVQVQSGERTCGLFGALL